MPRLPSTLSRKIKGNECDPRGRALGHGVKKLRSKWQIENEIRRQEQGKSKAKRHQNEGESIVDGDVPVHTGGLDPTSFDDFTGQDEWEDIEMEPSTSSGMTGGKFEYRAHRSNRVHEANEAWHAIMSDLIESYLLWERDGGQVEESGIEDQDFNVHLIELKERIEKRFRRLEGFSVQATLVRHGYFPTAPRHCSIAVSTSVLEIFFEVNAHCALLSRHAFVRGLCGLQQMPFKRSLLRAFSSAFDVYSEVRWQIKRRIDDALFQTQLGHFQMLCPCCTYRLKNEDPLGASMLVAMDGNSSLKRVERRRKQDGGLFRVTEARDERQRTSHMFLELDEVDRFAGEVRSRSSNNTVQVTGPNPLEVDENAEAARGEDTEEGGSPVDGVDGPSKCVDRWRNLAADTRKQPSWGIFDETGVFITACRHGVVLFICDMIRSGELAKYPLAHVDKLIENFGTDILVGYDIGCGFTSTAAKSPALGSKIRENRLRFCVNKFHGYAHNRRCQLQWHCTHQHGAGLEDFETCERVFSESNRVAGSTRHASKFHRRQAITHHFVQWNFDKFAELSTFLINNRKQAQITLAASKAAVEAAFPGKSKDVLDNVPRWHIEEQRYLGSPPPIPEVEQLGREYVLELQKLNAANNELSNAMERWKEISSGNFQTAGYRSSDTRATNKIERQRRAAREKSEKALEMVIALEEKLEVEVGARWTPTHPRWIMAECAMKEETYRQALDSLERLMVARLFELSKVNQAGTGYKMRTAIERALRTRSQAVRTAVGKYNRAVSRLNPPRPKLDFDRLLEVAELGEFELLQYSYSDVQSQPWAQSAHREVSKHYHLMLRAHEEIERVHIEARRLVVFMNDFERELELLAVRLAAANDPLEYQVQRRLILCRRFHSIHRLRLEKFLTPDEIAASGCASNGFTSNGPVVGRAIEVPENVIEDEEVGGEEEDTEDILESQVQQIIDIFTTLGDTTSITM